MKTSGFDTLGPVNLTIWSYDNQDPGLEPVLKELSSDFTKQYPNVKITMVFKSFNDLVNIVPRALASDDGPDITEGNQGYQTDAQLVKAGLIVPLDPYIKAYSWDKWYSPSTWSIFRWTNDGKTFGQGPTWGVAQTGQNVNIYVNAKKLSELGFDPNAMPTTFDDFNQMLADVRAKLPKDQPVIEAGNQEGYGFIHMFGGIQAAYVAPQDVRDWIMHVPGSTWDSPETVKALDDAAVVGQERLPERRLQRDQERRVGGRVRQGQGRLLDRRQLGLGDHRPGPGRRQRQGDALPAR